MKKISTYFILLGIVAVVVVLAYYYALAPGITATDSQSNSASVQSPMKDIGTTRGVTSEDKFVILTFDDSYSSHYSIVKPILDEFGFKATFFIVCNYQDAKLNYMNWDDVKTLSSEGHDIQSHTMNHASLSALSARELEYEIGQSKKCLLNHGINPTIFASPFGSGWDNSTVIDMISKYYELARNGYMDSTYLHCDGWARYTDQTDCRTYFPDGTLTWANRFSIRAQSHDSLLTRFNSETQAYEEFVRIVNTQETFRNGTVNEIPILIYHDVNSDRGPNITPIDLFVKEMKYLYENNFKVITMADLSYDESSNTLFVKNLDIKDITPPLIEAPPIIQAEATGPSTPVSLQTVVVDSIDPSPDVTNDAPEAFPMGSSVVHWMATDSAGHSATASQTVIVNDTTVSDLSIMSPENETTISGPRGEIDITIEGEALDLASGIKKVEVYVDSPPYKVATSNDDDWSTWHVPLTITSEGDHKVVAKATDMLGNSRWLTITIFVSYTDADGEGA